jgi:sortase A
LTTLVPPPVVTEASVEPVEPAAADDRRWARPAARSVAPPTPRRIVTLVVVWLVVAVGCSLLVLYGLEPLFEERTQHQLMTSYQADISHAHYATQGLGGVIVPTAAPDLGTPVGVLEVPRLELRQVVVEGVGASQTAKGPGHVPGTAGPGQPGNSAILGRRSMYGGAFGSLHSLHRGDQILITTTQGQSVYQVSSVASRTITTAGPAPVGGAALGTPSGGSGSSSGAGATANAQLNQSAAKVGAAEQARSVSVDQLYGPTKGDQLTLVTSDRVGPWNTSAATVVVAKMLSKPFTPTPQNGRTTNQTGLEVDPSAWPGLLLALQGFVLSGVAAVFLYRRFGMRIAYLITTPPLIAFVILLAEAFSHLLPAWT